MRLFSDRCHPKTVKQCKENPLSCHPFPLKLLPTCEYTGLRSRPRPPPPSPTYPLRLLPQPHAPTPAQHSPNTLPTPKSHVIPPGPHSSTAQKPRNINDLISKPETPSGELRAKLLGGTRVAPPGGRHGTCGAWPGIKPTISTPGPTGVEGAGGTGGHGRASRSTTPSRRPACGDLAGGRARRRPEHQRRNKHR